MTNMVICKHISSMRIVHVMNLSFLSDSLTPSSDVHISSLSALRQCTSFSIATKLWRDRVTLLSSKEYNLWHLTRDFSKTSKGSASGRWYEDQLREFQHVSDIHIQSYCTLINCTYKWGMSYVNKVASVWVEIYLHNPPLSHICGRIKGKRELRYAQSKSCLDGFGQYMHQTTPCHATLQN